MMALHLIEYPKSIYIQKQNKKHSTKFQGKKKLETKTLNPFLIFN